MFEGGEKLVLNDLQPAERKTAASDFDSIEEINDEI